MGPLNVGEHFFWEPNLNGTGGGVPQTSTQFNSLTFPPNKTFPKKKTFPPNFQANFTRAQFSFQSFWGHTPFHLVPGRHKGFIGWPFKALNFLKGRALKIWNTLYLHFRARQHSSFGGGPSLNFGPPPLIWAKTLPPRAQFWFYFGSHSSGILVGRIGFTSFPLSARAGGVFHRVPFSSRGQRVFVGPPNNTGVPHWGFPPGLFGDPFPMVFFRTKHFFSPGKFLAAIFVLGGLNESWPQFPSLVGAPPPWGGGPFPLQRDLHDRFFRHPFF